MKDIVMPHRNLEAKVVFTDPLIPTIESDEALVCRYQHGDVSRPYVLADGDRYLIFNGNHRILTAIIHGFDGVLRLIENDEDVRVAQQDDERLLPGVPLRYEPVLKQLRLHAAAWGSQQASNWAY